MIEERNKTKKYILNRCGKFRDVQVQKLLKD